jgi:hypothetical protein
MATRLWTLLKNGTPINKLGDQGALNWWLTEPTIKKYPEPESNFNAELFQRFSDGLRTRNVMEIRGVDDIRWVLVPITE